MTNPFLETQAFRRDGQDTTSVAHLFEKVECGWFCKQIEPDEAIIPPANQW